MESLRRLMSRKEDYPWKTVLHKWEEFTKSKESTCEGWNPWQEWCTSWENYLKSYSQTPKSGKKRAAVWQELYYLAKVTAHKLDEATAMRLHLKTEKNDFINLEKENLLLKTKCEFLQNNSLLLKTKSEAIEKESLLLKTECEALLKDSLLLKTKFEALQKDSLLLKTKCESLQKDKLFLKTKYELLQEEQDDRDYKSILDDQRHKQELEKAEKQKQAAQEKLITLRYDHLNNVIQCEKLEDEISALKREIVQVEEEKADLRICNHIEYNQRNIIINYPPIQQAIEERESWHAMAKRAGVGCPSRYNIWKRLECYEDPSLTVDNASYWQLVIRLSRYEDLGTKQPI